MRLPPTFFLILLTVIWGMTFPATKIGLETATPMQFLFLRFLLATSITLPIVVVRRFRRERTAPRVRWSRGGLIGLFYGLGFVLQTAGMRTTSASRSGFLTALLVIFTPILAWLLRTSRVSLRILSALPVAIAGVWLMTDPAVGALNAGDWMTIGCGLAFAFQMVLLEATRFRSDEIWEGAFMQIVVVALLAVTMMLIEGAPMRLSSGAWLAVVFNGLFGGVICSWLQTLYQPRVPAGYAAMVFLLEPVFAGIFSYFLLGEAWSLRSLSGAGLILAAMAIAGIKQGEKRPLSGE